MKVSGFTFIRNAIKYDYPIVEAIKSILPICDDFIVVVGNSEDNTRKIIESISPKITIVDSIWNETLRKGGHILAVETNKAFDAVPPDSDWAFYIQGDEVIHEKYLDSILSSMRIWKDDKNVTGLLFNYTHFYGSYDYIGDSRKWYRKEIRIIKNDKAIRSYKDAQGFRKNGEKLLVKQIDAFVYHYGWVKPPQFQQSKQQYFKTLWHDDKWLKDNIPATEEFDYSGIDSLAIFQGTHPFEMQNRIQKQNWKISFDPTQKKLSLKQRILFLVERFTGYRIGEYKNYKII